MKTRIPSKTKRLPGAKNISKIGMVTSAIIVLSYNFYYLIMTGKIPTLDEQKSILMLGGFIVVIFSPIYLSIVLDKIAEIFRSD
jgi:hypothetical protein